MLKCIGGDNLKPKIGIIKREEKNSLDVYINTIDKLGGAPCIIENFYNKKNVFKLVKQCNGILFTGGTTWNTIDEDILKYCLDNDVPFLGVCLGMQMIGDCFSADHEYGVDKTVQINNNKIHNISQKYAHKVFLNNGLLSSLFGCNEIMVNSYHNCCVCYTDDIRIKGYSEDGIIEALEIPNHPFGVGVQWHPEKMVDYDENSRKLLKCFINKSKK